MKQRKLTVLASAGLLLLASCGDPATTGSDDSAPVLQQPPPPPSPEVLAALKGQPFGSKTFGKINRISLSLRLLLFGLFFFLLLNSSYNVTFD